MSKTIQQYISNIPDKRTSRLIRSLYDTLFPSVSSVTQATNRTTGVTVTTTHGVITTNNTSLAAEASANFVVTCAKVAIGDVVLVCQRSGAVGAMTSVEVVAVANGSFTIRVANNNPAAGVAETGAIVINYMVMKSSASA